MRRRNPHAAAAWGRKAGSHTRKRRPEPGMVHDHMDDLEEEEMILPADPPETNGVDLVDELYLLVEALKYRQSGHDVNDGRGVAIAITHLETAVMWLERSL